jgi:signal peptidase I
VREAEPASPLEPPEEQPAIAVEAPVKRRVNPLLELVLILVAAFGLWYVLNGWVVKPYRIPSASMEPTLTAGDRVLVSRFLYHLHDPRRGDIVVFHPPGEGDIARAGAKHPASVYFIKRVIGLPGETVQAVGGDLEVCASPGVSCRTLKEPYLASPHSTSTFGPVKIPAGRYFMMGDNRADSDDSRDWGVLPRDYIVGEAFTTYWPLDRLRLL